MQAALLEITAINAAGVFLSCLHGLIEVIWILLNDEEDLADFVSCIHIIFLSVYSFENAVNKRFNCNEFQSCQAVSNTLQRYN